MGPDLLTIVADFNMKLNYELCSFSSKRGERAAKLKQ